MSAAATGRPLVAIVDPFSTGSQLAPEFARRGWDAIAVLSDSAVHEDYSRGFRAEDYRAVVDTTDVDDPVAAVRAYRPSQVITGSEWGVLLADRLSEALGLPGNGTRLSQSRRDKFAMVEQIRMAGVPAAASVLTTEAEKVLAWADTGGCWPLVVKPPASAGSDGVAFCSDASSVEEAFARIHGRTNQMGGFNSHVLAQEQLTGEQYFVNTVSLGGRHYVHEIWHERRARVGDRVVYDIQELLPPQGPVQQQLASYTVRVLDALGVAHGPAHTEVMLTPRGPVLIETGARLEGSVTSAGPIAATGTSQVALTVDACTDPERFAALPGTPYRLRRRMWVVCLIAPRDGHIAAGPLDRVRSLATYLCGSVDRLIPGTPVRRTVDLFTSPGHLYLVSDSLEAIERDYRVIRELERTELYGRAG